MGESGICGKPAGSGPYAVRHGVVGMRVKAGDTGGRKGGFERLSRIVSSAMCVLARSVSGEAPGRRCSGMRRGLPKTEAPELPKEAAKGSDAIGVVKS